MLRFLDDYGFAVQLFLGLVMLELLLGALVLRLAVKWRNKTDAEPVRIPSVGQAIGVMGVSILVSGAAVIGLLAVLFVLALAVARSESRVGELIWFNFWLFAPLTIVGLFLARAGIMARMLRAPYEDTVLVQLYEFLVYVMAAVGIGLFLFVLLFVNHLMMGRGA
jgi:hypothetical protein